MPKFGSIFSRSRQAALNPFHGVDGGGGEKTNSYRTILSWLRQSSLKPYFALSLVCLIGFLFLPPGELRLMATALAAAFFDFAVILLAFRLWPGGLAVTGLVMCVLVHAVGLAVLCGYGMLGYLSDFDPFSSLIYFEGRVLLMLVMLPLAMLLVLGGRQALGLGQTVPRASEGDAQQASNDQRMPALLICSALFSLLFWIGSELSVGMAQAVCQALQRTFFFVSFIAGFHFRCSRAALITWVVVLAANLSLGIVTGSRGPAFMPVILFALGLLCGATFRQRLGFLAAMTVLAIPMFYVFGMIEVVRNDVGRLKVSELSSTTIKEVATGLRGERQKEGDSYEELPSMARAVIRAVNWPNLVVAATAGRGSGRYSGFADLADQLRASLNIVAVTGKMDDYYVAGLYNLRASEYGFHVEEGTSVEFGLLAESWDRGGPVAAFIYSLIAIVMLGALEEWVRSLLKQSPALRAIMVSTLFTTAYWTLNCYNLPLSMRQLAVNLVFCVAVCGTLNMVLPCADEPVAEAGTARLARVHTNRPKTGFMTRRRRR
jgi:hypothetical protein